jgi:hypothetical protein
MIQTLITDYFTTIKKRKFSNYLKKSDDFNNKIQTSEYNFSNSIEISDKSYNSDNYEVSDYEVSDYEVSDYEVSDYKVSEYKVNDYSDLNENVNIFRKKSKSKTKIYGYNEQTDSWHCTICGEDMGSSNPRQLCGKYKCFGVNF